MTSLAQQVIHKIGPISVIILCGGMGKRMRQETQGRISKVELAVPLPTLSNGVATSETLVGLLVRMLKNLQPYEILLLTSDKFKSAHARLARELADRYGVNVRCRSDAGSGDEFPPGAVADIAEQIGSRIDRKRGVFLLNGDTLFGPQALHSFVHAVSEKGPLMALGEADGVEYLGLLYFSCDLKWRDLMREIAATTVSDLVSGLWKRLSVITVKLDGRAYDCGSVEGYRTACTDGASGKLW